MGYWKHLDSIHGWTQLEPVNKLLKVFGVIASNTYIKKKLRDQMNNLIFHFTEPQKKNTDQS